MKQLLPLLLLLISLSVQAQYYENAAGLRLGGTSGITYKRFVTESVAYQVLLSGRNDGIQFTALKEIYIQTNLSKNLFIYYGGGAHLGFEKYTQVNNNINTTIINNNQIFETRTRVNPTYFSMGLDGIVGLEYRFMAPVTLGFDVKPTFSFIGMRFTQLRFWDTAMTVKLLF
ncbi:hypothetical protein QQ008_10175 [Fulvivirgaceae bacterium BMA10]|uniref:Outer membrane protein beta-barrel domain-containing protein n=1 Tax=Splendidivirga corallicola TaxID=3051826 RepID=A0ABT8KLZ1_9BACT|nr:hypothetical protein [Fulvivirgaceae bacterium BMA10]